jgi:hypothetical protein
MLYEELIIKDGLQEELSNDYYYKEDSQWKLRLQRVHGCCSIDLFIGRPRVSRYAANLMTHHLPECDKKLHMTLSGQINGYADGW